jgi:hypothetical protein
MPYSSVSQIKNDFQLTSDDLDIIRDALNNLRADIHPDRNNGDFNSNEEKERFHQINDAINYVDGLRSNSQLMVVEKMTDLVKVIADLIPGGKQNSLQNSLEQRVNFAVDHYKSPFKVPKISLSAVTGIITFLVAFPTQIQEHPLLNKLVDSNNSIFVTIWLGLLIYTGFFWLLSYRDEERAKRQLMTLKIDSFQNQLFNEFIHNVTSSFTKDHLTEFVYQKSQIRSSIPLFKNEAVTMEIAQNISEIILSKAEAKGIIHKIETTDMSDTFMVKLKGR